MNEKAKEQPESNQITQNYKTDSPKFEGDLTEVELYKYFQNMDNPRLWSGADASSSGSSAAAELAGTASSLREEIS